MSHESSATLPAAPEGLKGVTADWSADKQAFPVPWGKAMMWIFLLSDTFIFSCFLISYMNVRMSTTDIWPNPSEVFSLTVFGTPVERFRSWPRLGYVPQRLAVGGGVPATVREVVSSGRVGRLASRPDH